LNKSIFVILSLFFLSCVHDPINTPENTVEKYPELSKPITHHIIENFITVDDDLEKIPETEIKITLTEPVKFSVLFLILQSQGINIIGNLPDKEIQIPSYSGNLRQFLKSLQMSYGLFFRYADNTLIVKDTSPVYVKVLMPGTGEALQKLLSNLGVKDSYYDELSSRIVFQSDFFTYDRVQSYFSDNSYLSLVVFDVMILEKEESDDKINGFDWSQFNTVLKDLSSPGSLSIAGDGSGVFSLKIDSSFASLASVYKNLSTISNFKILQSARVSTINGSECKLDVSEKIPYVSKINISSLATFQGGAGNTVQGFEFSNVSNGLILTLKPVVSDNIINLAFDAKIESLTKFIEIGSSTQTIQQPIVSTRGLKNQVVIRPGETSLIGGLRYSKGSLLDKSLTFLDSFGVRSTGVRTFSIQVLLRSELIRYTFKKGLKS